MKELGRILKAKRTELGLSEADVHKATRIQEKYIQAIEEGEEKAFSALVYYKSFVKSYAKFLSLDSDELLAGYEKRKTEKDGEDSGEEYSSKKKHTSSPESEQEKKHNLKRLFLTILITGILCGIFLYLNKNLPSFLYEDRPAYSEQRQIHIEKEKREKSKRMKESAVSDVKTGELSGEMSQRENSSNNDELSSGSIKKQNDKQELIVSAVENVWIKVDGDGKELFQGTIVKGSKRIWTSEREFTVQIGYTPGVSVYFNGEKVDVEKDAVQDVNTLFLRGRR